MLRGNPGIRKYGRFRLRGLRFHPVWVARWCVLPGIEFGFVSPEGAENPTCINEKIDFLVLLWIAAVTANIFLGKQFADFSSFRF